MQIPNPWSHHPLSRCTCKTPKGDVISIGVTRGPLEVPDDSAEVLIEPVKYVRAGVVEPIGQGRIWSKEYGMLDIEDHIRKMKIKEQEEQLEKRIKRENTRKSESVDQSLKQKSDQKYGV